MVSIYGSAKPQTLHPRVDIPGVGKGYSEASASAKHVLAELKRNHLRALNPPHDVVESVPPPSLDPKFLDRLPDLKLGRTCQSSQTALQTLRGRMGDESLLALTCGSRVRPLELQVRDADLRDFGDQRFVDAVNLLQAADELDREGSAHAPLETLSSKLTTDSRNSFQGKKRRLNGWTLFWQTKRASDVGNPGESKDDKEKRVLGEARAEWHVSCFQENALGLALFVLVKIGLASVLLVYLVVLMAFALHVF